ncbi:NrsF family protein [Segnochrobactrum spirostomi]|uniref:DUF1109 family protein n=1 Tax=Segnochrobactrum spirostomi TaxID=2608987 RepID=A0A6A7XZA1_9HYPH|nr:DUF1109 domain-containing protein [Segnochrobactrum spirostomi]MQT11089.1 DUF1109 family protein [Segnochrobactrum spirostomi]
MKTNDLIAALVADGPKRAVPQARYAALVLAVALPLAAAIFLITLHVRPDIALALGTVRFPFKFVVTLSLAVPAAALALRLGRPDATPRRPAIVLALPLTLLAAGLGFEAATIPSDAWAARWIGSNALFCLFAIPFLSLVPLAAIMLVLRHGAPADPRLAGLVGGLAAGAIGATLYAAHCPDDSPFFVATWYAIAIGGVTLVGRWLGPRLLRW